MTKKNSCLRGFGLAPLVLGAALSGVSGGAAAQIREARQEATEQFLPQATQAVTAGTLNAVTERVVTAAGGGRNSLSLWGRIDDTRLEGEDSVLRYDGEARSFNLGVDRISGHTLIGVALSTAAAEVDYTHKGTAGDYEYDMVTLTPYFGWSPNELAQLWGAAGYGQGEITSDNGNTTDTTSQSLALGMTHHNLRNDDALLLSLQQELLLSRLEVDKNKDVGLTEQTLNGWRMRALLSGENRHEYSGGGRFTSHIQSGLRFNNGDGVSGWGGEAGLRLRYDSPARGLRVEGSVRTLVGYDDYDQWGAHLGLRFSPEAGRGLYFDLRPTWGATASRVQSLLEEGGVAFPDGSPPAAEGRMNMELGYGLTATLLGTTGALTPYIGLTTADDGHDLRLGGRFTGNGMDMALEGAHREDGSATLELQAARRW